MSRNLAVSVSYMPPPSYFSHRGDPIDRLPGGDELVAELTAAIAERLTTYGERHVHPKRGGCDVCAATAADTAVRYLEGNTRVIHSEALAPEEFGRARAALAAIPYLGSGHHLRLKGDLAADPDYPTVDDLLRDLETIRDGVTALVERDRDREHELRRYRAWRDAVAGLATEIVERIDPIEED